jgi:hypothetical protein
MNVNHPTGPPMTLGNMRELASICDRQNGPSVKPF